ncbi:MAG: PIN domain-containing protein [Gammaproteobacteria bacterium]|nr:PIN domain-containing protein [Gammaproteobacteria bacterium]MDE0365108.1 PIN domain-containing protein [Gammaproteobacteria bacterium]
MIAIDTNLLVYAHRPEMPFHDRARKVLTDAVAGPEPVSVPWPCAHEFLAVVSNPRIFTDPTPIGIALDAIGRLLESLTGGFLSEGEGYLGSLERIARPALLQGAVVHDARIAALCLYHGVRVLWSADRDFSRFPNLAVANPLPVS